MLNRVIKSTMEKVDNNSVKLLPRVLRAVKFNPALQKEMEERGIKKIMTTQRQGGATSTCVPRTS